MERVTLLRRLGVACVALTVLLMVLGAWVKANGAGLACPDWPACYGKWLPPFPSAENGGTYHGEPVRYSQDLILYEWTHRLVASVLGPPLLAFAALAFFTRTASPQLRYLPAAALAILVVQYGLGGLTVVKANPAWATTLHLLTATVFLLVVTVAACFAFLRPLPVAPAPHPRPPPRRSGDTEAGKE